MDVVVTDATVTGKETARLLLEADLNGYRLPRTRRLDWEAQAATAIRAFERNGFFVFVGDRQVDDLDQELTLADSDVVSFVRLVPLVGG